MKSRREWDRFDWSEALLQSYFGRTPNEASVPVKILVVTDDRLAQVVGEVVPTPAEVRLSLINTVKRSVGDNNYWTHASTQVDRPVYLAHLIVACIAAVDASDIDERSYLTRLVEIAGPSAEHGIERMAELWSKLQRWLTDRPEKYQPLILP